MPLPNDIARRPVRSSARVAALGVALIALVAFTGCNADTLDVPNFNSPTPEGLSGDPLGGLQVAANGIVFQNRSAAAGFNIGVGVLGREAYNYTASEPRNTLGWLQGPRLLSSGFAGVSNWAPHYVNLRNIFNFTKQVDATASLSAQQKQAALGFAQTFEALELLPLIMTRDTIGIPVEIQEDPAFVAPFVTRDSAYAHIIGRLDAAKVNLAAGGTSFGFTISNLFGGGVSLTTPAALLQFNRAIYARVQVYRATLGLAACGAGGVTCFNSALTALGESFMSATASSPADLARGVSYIYSTAAGDATNALNQSASAFLAAHVSWEADAPKKADGSLDNRYVAKIRKDATSLSPPAGVAGKATPYRFQSYPALDSPLAIIRNEELILLRAEVYLGLGQLANAIADIDRIRTVSGGLAPSGLTAASTRDAIVTELLLQRRYSLALEGHRWMDLRRYGKLSTLPLDDPTHIVAPVIPVPQADCLFRGTTTVPRAGCVGV